MLKPRRRHDIPATAAKRDLALLIAKIQTGDQSALASLYDATVGKVYARVLRLTGNVADAEDVTIDVYHQLWRNPEKVDPQRGNPFQWLMVIARSRALDCCRKRIARAQAGRAVDLGDSDMVAQDEDVLDQYEVTRILSVPLSQLNSIQSHIIGLSFFDGLSHREIAARTRMPLGTVKSHLCRALLTMRKSLTGTGATNAVRNVSQMPAARDDVALV